VPVKNKSDEGRSNQVFLRAFYSELLGRYHSLLSFVEESRLDAKGRSAHLFAAYSAQVREAIKDLVSYRSWFKERLTYRGTSAEALFILFDFLSDSSVRFQKLHDALRSFATPWPETEVAQFLTQLFQENNAADLFATLHPTIIYSDEFNFLKYDLRDEFYLPKGASALAVWTLPKAESNNPLLWPVLAHEVAHSLFSDNQLIRLDQLIQTQFKKADYVKLKRWSIEFNADYFAYRLLGPAYLSCLVYLCMFFVADRLREPISSQDRNSSSHPPPHVGVRFLLRELEAEANQFGSSYASCSRNVRGPSAL
jgi:hypothetical protein